MPTFLWIWVLTASLPDPPVEPAVAVLSTHCGSCHDGALPTAKAGALAVFNLRDPGFITRLSDERLGKLLGRMSQKGTADERQTIDQWVDQERRRRAAR